jgi:exopolysaccharide biosynthesis polyprenyl glycosylphosphotransferase
MGKSLAVLDMGALVAASMVAAGFGPALDQAGMQQGLVGLLLIAGGFCIAAFYYSDLYDPRVVRGFPDFPSRLLRPVTVLVVPLAIAYLAVPTWRPHVIPLAVMFGMTVALMMPTRAAYYRLMQERPFVRRIVILGTGPLAKKIADEIIFAPSRGYSLEGFVDDREPGAPWDGPGQLLGHMSSLADIINRVGADGLVLALTERRGRQPVDALLSCCAGGTWVMEGLEFYEELTLKVAIERFNPSALLFARSHHRSRALLFARRALSCGIAAAGLILSAPLMAIAALLIKLDSSGPVFFLQERFGLGGRVFKVIKFRTMYEGQDVGASVWNRNSQSRITPVGRWLRRLRIDELPQFLNVLKGDMDLVGPRPEMASNVQTMTEEIPFYPLRHIVRPGLTGWAQVKYGYSISRDQVAEKTCYDLYYVKNMSLGLDAHILVDTVKIVLFGRGA